MTEHRLEELMGNLLRAGVLSAGAIVLAGGIWLLAAEGLSQPAYHHFHARVYGLRSFGTLSAPEAVVLVGLLALIATPIARVVFAVIAFALRRDRAYIIISLVVLAVLLYSIGTSWL